MIKYVLPIAEDWRRTFIKWAGEFRVKTPLESLDFLFRDFDPLVSLPTGTISSLEVDRAKFLNIGRICFISLAVSFVTDATDEHIQFSLPLSSAAEASGQGVQRVSIVVLDNSLLISGTLTIESGSVIGKIRPYNDANFTIGQVGIFGNFFYEIN